MTVTLYSWELVAGTNADRGSTVAPYVADLFACPLCEDVGEVLVNASIYSEGRPEIVPCPDCGVAA